MKRVVSALLFVLLLFSCEKPWPQDLSDEARAVMDRVVGEYVLTGIEWDGAPADLDGDGHFSGVMEEMETLGVSSDSFYATSDKTEIGRTDGYISAVIMMARHIVYGQSGWEFTEFGVSFFFNVRNGLFEVDWNRTCSDYTLDGEEIFRNVDVAFSGDDIMNISGDTLLFDGASGQSISGRITYIFTCISGKGKKDGKQN